MGKILDFLRRFFTDNNSVEIITEDESVVAEVVEPTEVIEEVKTKKSTNQIIKELEEVDKKKITKKTSTKKVSENKNVEKSTSKKESVKADTEKSVKKSSKKQTAKKTSKNTKK